MHCLRTLAAARRAWLTCVNTSTHDYALTTRGRLQSSEGFWKAGGFRGIYKGLGAAAAGSAPGGAYVGVEGDRGLDAML